MRLQATEDDVYRLMDLRERYDILVALISVAEGICLYLLYQMQSWDRIYICSALAVVFCLFLRQIIGMSQKIMEAQYCYLELDEDSLAVCQPEKNGHYESCRIFYDEIDKIVEGVRRGIPEFYVVLIDRQEELESFILLDEEEQKRRIFCVRSFGFDRKKFIQFYRTFCWNVPGRVRIIGTKQQNVWSMRNPNVGFCLGVALTLGYVLPKIIEVMELF